MTVSHKESFQWKKYECICVCVHVVVLWFIPKKMYICFLVRLLTKPLPLCTPRLQHKHIPNLQQRPGTAMSTLLPRSRARETSLPTSLEVHRVKAHSQKSPHAFVICCLLNGCGCASARNVIFLLCSCSFQSAEGSAGLLKSLPLQPSCLFADLIPDTQPFEITSRVKTRGIPLMSSDYWLFPEIPAVK